MKQRMKCVFYCDCSDTGGGNVNNDSECKSVDVPPDPNSTSDIVTNLWNDVDSNFLPRMSIPGNITCINNVDLSSGSTKWNEFLKLSPK